MVRCRSAAGIKPNVAVNVLHDRTIALVAVTDAVLITGMVGTKRVAGAKLVTAVTADTMTTTVGSDGTFSRGWADKRNDQKAVNLVNKVK